MEKVYYTQNNDGKFADKYIFYCTTCKQCYEETSIKRKVDNIWRRLDGYYYYKDFPTYGKEKKECLQCKGMKIMKLDYVGMIFHYIVKDSTFTPRNKHYGEIRNEK
tara:strand:+ start:2097 stop:2414 length:318 start_codon:yes stop_codon:yes gene_type:complete